MSAPVAPKNPITLLKEGDDMAAASLKVLPHRVNTKEDVSLLTKLYGGILMTVSKATSPSVTISPAVIGLVITIILQTCIGVWWAASLSKEVENKDNQIKELKSDMATMKVYIDTSREKQVRLEAKIDQIEKEQQVTNLVIQKGLK